jgi:hypothetical protein
MGARTHFDKTDRVVDGLVCVAMPFDVPVRLIAVTDDCSARFETVTKTNHHGGGASVRIENYECFSSFNVHITYHPLPFHFVAPFVLSPTELPVVNFDGLVRTAEFLRALQNIDQPGLSIYIGPIWMFANLN